jgi:hypothetical protein
VVKGSLVRLCAEKTNVFFTYKSLADHGVNIRANKWLLLRSFYYWLVNGVDTSLKYSGILVSLFPLNSSCVSYGLGCPGNVIVKLTIGSENKLPYCILET